MGNSQKRSRATSHELFTAEQVSPSVKVSVPGAGKWESVKSEVPGISKRYYHVAVAFGRYMVIYGGTSSNGELVAMDMDDYSWFKIPTSGTAPPPVGNAKAALVDDGAFVIWGGTNTDTHTFDYETRTWTKLPTTGDPPSARTGHILWTNYREGLRATRMYIHGQGNSTTHLLDLTSNKWRAVGGVSPPGIGCHSGVLFEETQRLLMTGAGLTYLWVEKQNDGYWIDMKRSNLPSLHSHASARVRDNIYVHGGYGDGGRGEMFMTKTIPEFVDPSLIPGGDIPPLTWTKIEFGDCSVPSRRWGHSLVVHDSQLVMFGGYGGGDYLNDVWIFETGLHTRPRSTYGSEMEQLFNSPLA